MFKSPQLLSKSVVYQNKNNTELQYVDKVVPLVPKGDGYGVKDDEILVKIYAAAFNPVDFIMAEMKYPIFNYIWSHFGLCYDYSGEIVDIGEKAQAKFGYKVGDKVCGQTNAANYKNTLTEYVNFEMSKPSGWSMTKVPKNLSMEEAGSFSLVYSTAYAVARDIAGENVKVLVNGGSTSVGSYVISLLKLNPNIKEIVSICSSRSEQKVKSLGATDIIDYTQTEDITSAVLEHCRDRNFDAYLDCTGSEPLLKNVTQFVVEGGDVRLISGGKKNKLADRKPAFSLFTYDLLKALVLSAVGRFPVKAKMLATVPGDGFDKVVELFEQGKIKPFVDSVYTFDKAQDAFDHALTGKNSGKVVIKVAQD